MIYRNEEAYGIFRYGKLVSRRNRALHHIRPVIGRPEINVVEDHHRLFRDLEANRQDYGTAEANGMSAGLLDRLKLTAQRIHKAVVTARSLSSISCTASAGMSCAASASLITCVMAALEQAVR